MFIICFNIFGIRFMDGVKMVLVFDIVLIFFRNIFLIEFLLFYLNVIELWNRNFIEIVVK